MLRFGLIIPSSNTTMEREFSSALRGIATIHSARIKLKLVNVPELTGLEDDALAEASKLADAGVDVIGFGCTSGSFVKGEDQFKEIEDEVWKETGVPTVSTAGAVVDALKRLGGRRVVLVTPYTADITKIERYFLEYYGFKAADVFYASMLENEDIGRILDEEVLWWVMKTKVSRADSVFVSCTNLSTFKVLRRIEEKTGLPTISSNSATLWAMLRKVDRSLANPKLGRLLTLH